MSVLPMFTLHLAHTFSVSQNQYNIEVTLSDKKNDRVIDQVTTENFSFVFTAEERENLCWYLEDFLQYNLKLEAERGQQREQEIKEIGTRLFEAVFPPGSDAENLWVDLRDRIKDTRVEIEAKLSEAATIPWELIRDSRTDMPLALGARAFVRIHCRDVQPLVLPEKPSGCVRILLVICRPSGREDEAFRSVASPLVRKLYENPDKIFQLDVLRPPTYSQLAKVLGKAKDDGKPYHIVHFDGHGGYSEINPDEGNEIYQIRRQSISPLRPGWHGYLLFENPQVPENLGMVNGPKLGSLLVDTKVPVLLLNACRSARAEPPRDLLTVESDLDAWVRAFGSLAQEVMAEGVAGVVAMSYKVYVDAAAQFMADLYYWLMQELTLGEAATRARKQLNDDPMRNIVKDPYPLQDWCVPVVYEAEPIALFSKCSDTSDNPDNLTLARKDFCANLPLSPDTGFFGRDQTILAIERAFDRDNIVLLEGEDGSGKTATVAEFGRWYALTGGVDGPVLFADLQELTKSGLFEEIGLAFVRDMEAQNLKWQQNDERILWIWDGVDTEIPQLTKFLRMVPKTKAKFLLTAGKRPEWLGTLATSIWMPPMLGPERVLLAREVARKYNKNLDEIENCQSLLESTRGNPATIIEKVTQAVEGRTTREPSEVSATQQQGENMPTDVPETSDWYVERPPIESICYQTITEPGSLLRIKARKQMGKTSLITKIIKQAKQQGYHAAEWNLYSVEQEKFTNLDRLLQDFCAKVSDELGLQSQEGEFWDENLSDNMNCTAYFEKRLLPKADRALVMCLDNVDLVFPHGEIATDFLGLLRFWHEQAKTHQIWKKLRLVVAHSTEIYIELKMEQSPFNVGKLIELPELTSEQMLDLTSKYGLNFTETEIEQLQEMVGGHLYLVKEALDHLKNYQNETLDQLLQSAPTKSGIYSTHLRGLWQYLQLDTTLKDALKEVVASQEGVRLDPMLAYKLQLLGLIKLKGNDSSPRCELYRLYFSENLEDIR